MDVLTNHARELQEALQKGSWKVLRYPCGEKLTAAKYRTRYVSRYILKRLGELDFNDQEAVFLESLQDLLDDYHKARISWKEYAKSFQDILNRGISI